MTDDDWALFVLVVLAVDVIVIAIATVQLLGGDAGQWVGGWT